MSVVPAILAPAGSKSSFLSAIAAGADAVYCGLKTLSARMAAVNFAMEELVPLVELAHHRGVKVFITLNSLLKPTELDTARDTVVRLQRYVRPDALIIQDIAYVSLAREVGFEGELHLSTLANATFPRALPMLREALQIDRVVLPRELNIDEIKTMAAACPEGLSLELFIHGALCFGVSGRCYWSSFMGGKSGLRGRCVQPCRRRYTQGKEVGRFFSCQDLSLDVLCKVLLAIPEIRTWKIEGRRKGPHYVYYTVQAYRMLRDEGRDPQAKKAAMDLLAQALGRPGTHYYFLPQRPQNPVRSDAQSGSGMEIGKCRGPRSNPYVIPREALLSGDLLRIGYEDEAWHSLQKIQKFVPKRGRLYVKVSDGRGPETGTPVFLVDRIEGALAEKIAVLADALSPLPALPDVSGGVSPIVTGLQRPTAPRQMYVFRHPGPEPTDALMGCWLTSEALAAISKGRIRNTFWWLPPVVWPSDEAALADLIDQTVRAGGDHFVLNVPWQVSFFSDASRYDLWAGPFCNMTNPMAIECLSALGFSGVMVTPELGEPDLLSLPRHSRIPMGMVVSGHWPLSIARGGAVTLDHGEPYVSPKGEQAWISRYGADEWVFPNWKIDLTAKQDFLRRAGYQLLVHLQEPVPPTVELKQRPGLWNWEVGLT